MSGYRSAVTVAKLNRAQHELRAAFDPFFTALHDGLKHLDRIVRAHEKALADEAGANGKRGGGDRRVRQLKAALEALHAEVKSAESFFAHIRWLQERFMELTKGTFKRIEILTPPQSIMEKFGEVERPLFKAIESHLRANATLTRTRDLLLPRLISGKLRVDDLDIQFPPSMAAETASAPRA